MAPYLAKHVSVSVLVPTTPEYKYLSTSQLIAGVLVISIDQLPPELASSSAANKLLHLKILLA